MSDFLSEQAEAFLGKPQPPGNRVGLQAVIDAANRLWEIDRALAGLRTDYRVAVELADEAEKKRVFEATRQALVRRRIVLEEHPDAEEYVALVAAGADQNLRVAIDQDIARIAREQAQEANHARRNADPHQDRSRNGTGASAGA